MARVDTPPETPADRGGASPATTPPRGPTLRQRFAPGGTTALVVKLVALTLVNGLALIALPIMVRQRSWLFLGFVVVSTVLIDVVYLSPRRIPGKYLVPGTIFLIAFQVFPVLYTGYLAFTNYGTGNNLGSREQAVEQLQATSLRPVADAPRFEAAAMATGAGDLALLLTDEQGEVFLGVPDEGLTPVDEAGEVTRDGDVVTAVGDYARLGLREAQDRQAELTELRIPLDDGAEAGELRLGTFTSAVVYESRYQEDPDTGEVVDIDSGTIYTEVDGSFVADDGERLPVGWFVPIGFDNFAQVLTSPAIRGPFLRVFVWTYAFAILSVVFTFTVGLGLAIALNDERLRSRRVYRSLLVIPYALPSFLTALIWAGLLNTEFGAVNRMLGTEVPWLDNAWLAMASVLLVNTWLGFPYMFLVTTGGLQAIPGDLIEAARVDGATGFGAFRRVTFPLLLVSVAPLLIASFAFNFNNFNIIYLLTGGDPPIPGATTPAGSTDILISYMYRLAFAGGRGQDFGLAAAISVIIFLMVAAITAYSFRATKTLEEIN